MKRLVVISASCFLGLAIFNSIEPDAALAQKSITEASSHRQCPDVRKIHGLCALVANQLEDKTPGTSFQYRYERMVYDAACADYDADSDEVIADKVQKLFATQAKELTCESTDFDVVDGSVLKYAINGRTFGFVNKAIDEWHIDLNKVDDDGTTLLDYIERQIARSRGTSLELTLQMYYNKVRKAGGLHSREIGQHTPR